MSLKPLAAAAVVLGCGYLGMVAASGLDLRIVQIEQLMKMLQQLEFHISFLSLPLPEAIRRTATMENGVVQKMLRQVSVLLDKVPGITVGEAWQDAVRSNRKNLCLKQTEFDALDEFTSFVGRGDTEAECNNLKITAAKLKLSMEQAKEKRKRDGKIYRGAGFLAGILIVILLY